MRGQQKGGGGGAGCKGGAHGRITQRVSILDAGPFALRRSLQCGCGFPQCSQFRGEAAPSLQQASPIPKESI